jgi:hypothetical protein
VTAHDILKAARAAALRITIDGDDLALEAAAEPASDLLDAIRTHKPEILALLRAENDDGPAT